MKLKIALYDGEGASPTFRPAFLSLNPILLTAKEIIAGALEKVDVFILPGGRDLPYHAALQGPGNAQIRSFVEKGGKFIGICAGAYYGCSQVVFDPGHPLEVCGERELKFFPGSGIGPAYGFGTFHYNSPIGARAALLETEIGVFRAYYNGGCYFEGDLTDCKILARYGELAGKPPAIISRSIGQGEAILSGVHIEASPDILAEADPLLRASEEMRQKFWNLLI
ncbi:MAG: biotin--protein ligase [Verrucomicrobia bacterium]|nr:biotin--protein ligase [Verrucomicrobiota bacterium]